MSEVFYGAGSTFKNRSIAGLLIEGGRGNAALTDEQLFQLAPAAFAEGKHDSRTDRYAYIPTIRVAQALRAEGFYPVAASQGKSRIEGKAAFTKHMIRFRRELDIDMDSGEAVPETVLINSHDGTSSYWMLEGAFRGVCKNGLIVATGDVNGFKVGHYGKIIDRVIEGSYRVIDNATRAIEATKAWAQIELQPAEQLIFAQSAAALRFDTHQEINPASIIAPRREADMGNDLWTVFNRAQESLIRGGNMYNSRSVNEETGRVTVRHQRSRPVKSVDGNVGLNRALWTLGAEMAKLKA
jgi:Domain of unknown function (DUF932)